MWLRIEPPERTGCPTAMLSAWTKQKPFSCSSVYKEGAICVSLSWAESLKFENHKIKEHAALVLTERTSINDFGTSDFRVQ
eukprot:248130-Pelagomonas_calceolata.AAC.1